jgi:PKD repeat protein
VATNGGNVAPYASWANAATNIHDAVALAGNNDTVLVSNGLFRLTNQTVFTSGWSLRSVNGPDATTLWRGSASPFALFTVSNANALLTGFILTNGYVTAVQGAGVNLFAGVVSNCVIAKCQAGYMEAAAYLAGGLMTGCIVSNNGGGAGGVYMTGGALEDCVVVANMGTGGNNSRNGGIYMTAGVVRRCRILGNATEGTSVGGVSCSGGRIENSSIYGNRGSSGYSGINLGGGVVVNSTIASNSAVVRGLGAGIYRSGGTITNCIVYGNGGNAPNDNYYGTPSAAWYSCAPELTNAVQGNVTANPRFVDMANGDLHLAAASPCVDTGTNLPGIVTDMDRRTRPLAGDSSGLLRHDMGAYEKDGSLGSLQVGFSGSPLSGFNSVTSVFAAAVAGTNATITWWGWDFDNNGSYEQTGAGLAVVTNTFGPGRYTVSVRVTNSAGETASNTNLNYVLVVSPNIYVSTNGGSVLPYSTWNDAATDVLDAVAVALPGCTLWITNGSYRLTNQISVYSGFTVRSMNGSDATTLWRDAAFGNFPIFDIRDSGASVFGLTLTNGNVDPVPPGSAVSMSAGTVSNCVLTKCQGGFMEAAAYLSGGLISGCIISNNGGGAGGLYLAGGVAEDCTIVTNLGTGGNNNRCGGAYLTAGIARRCRIMRNTSAGASAVAGVYMSGGRVENCLICGNRGVAAYGGINMAGGTVVNCTIADNTAVISGSGGGLNCSAGTVTNCIIYGNGGNGPNDNFYGTTSAVWYSCAPELTAGVQSNVTGNPKFVNTANSDYRLAVGSPCIDTGTNLPSITEDIDRRSRPRAGDWRGTLRHDMGPFEKDGSNSPLEVGFSGSPLSGYGSVTSVFSVVVAGTNTTITWWGWDFDNNGVFDSTGAGLATVTNVFGPGRHTVSVRITNSIGETASSTNLNYVLVVSPDIYVSTNGASLLPYATWADAATNVLDAVAVALPGCTIWITNGSYRLTNQLSLFSGFSVRSVNGPNVTTLWRDGAFGSFPIFDIRDAGATVSGLTLTNGYVSPVPGGAAVSMSAGAVSNCVITKCQAGFMEAAAYLSGGLISDCIVSNNGGGAGGLYMTGGAIQDCAIVVNRGTGGNNARCGGLYMTAGIARRCRIGRNTSEGLNGVAGVYVSGGRIENSLIYSNSATPCGGISLTGGALVNCTIAGNSTPAGQGSGINRTGGVITNSIIYGNGTNGNALNDNYYGTVSAVWYSCAPELTAGVQGNVTGNPNFRNVNATDFHLRSGSPCVDKGITLAGMATQTDLDGAPRLVGGKMDIGAYEVTFLGSVIMIR